MTVFEIQKGSGEHVIENYSNKDSVIFQDYEGGLNWGIYNDKLKCSKVGDNLVIERYLDENQISVDSSVILCNYFKINQKYLLNDVNGYKILGEGGVILNITGSGEISGTFLDDCIMGSNNNDIIYSSGGADDVDAGAGDDVIYTSNEGSYVTGNKGDDTIYVKKSSINTENCFYFNSGDGNDVIHNSGYYDSIEFRGINPNNVVYRKDGNDLIIQNSEEDSIKLVDWFKKAATARLNKISFMDENLSWETRQEIELKDVVYQGNARNNVLNVFDNSGRNVLVYPGKGYDIINVNGAGTKYIDLAKAEGSTTVRFGDNIGDCNVVIKYDIPNITQEDDYEFCFDKDGDNLKIYAVDWNKSGSKIIDTITIENYYNNQTIQSNLYFYNFMYTQENEPVLILTQLNKDCVQSGTFYKEATNRGGELNTEEIESSVIYLGGNGYDIMKSNPHKTNGDQFYTGNKGITEIYSGIGNDYIEINNFSNSNTSIYDSLFEDPSLASEEDELHLNTTVKGDGAYLFFDVAKDEGNPPYDYSPNLYITKNNNILSYMTPKYTPGFVSIENWFADRYGVDEEGNRNGPSSGSGKIEHIYINNGEIDVDEFIDMVTVDVRNWLTENGKYQSAMEVLERGTRAEKQEIISLYTKEAVNIHLTNPDPYEKQTFNGSNGNDRIYVAENYIVNSGNGNDKIFREEFASNYTLNGENGNDILTAGENTIINGGAGVNVIRVDSDTDTVITQGRGYDYIHLTNEIRDFENLNNNVKDVKNVISNLNYTKNNNDLVMEIQNGAKITLENYFKYGNKSSIKGIIDNNTNIDYYETAEDIAKEVQIQAQNNTIDKLLKNENVQLTNTVIPVRDKFNGTAYNDVINASTVYLEKIVRNGRVLETTERSTNDKGLTINAGNGNNSVVGTKYSDTIIGGKDNDRITGGLGIDTITGGAGQNTIVYNSIDEVTGDRIYLTKGEEFLLDFSNMPNTTVGYKVNGRDLDVTVTNAFGQSETLKLINFGAYDITNNANPRKGIEDSSYVKIKTSTQPAFDVRDVLLSENRVVKNYAGSYFQDNINAIDAPEGRRGAGLTLRGGIGNDSIKGSNYNDAIYGDADNDTLDGNGGNDAIYGGAGNDTITGGLGNDTITGGAGQNTIVYNSIDEVTGDRIYLTKGEEFLLDFSNMPNTTVGYKVNGRDLDVTVTNAFGQSETLKLINFGAYDITNNANPRKGIEDSSYVKIKTSTQPAFDVRDVLLSENRVVKNYAGSYFQDNINAIDAPEGRRGAGLTLRGGIGNDSIKGSNYNDAIYGDADNDTLEGNGGNDTIYGGAGIDTINGGDDNDIIYGGIGGDTIEGGSGNDKIYGEAGDDTLNGNDGDDLIYGGVGNDTIDGGQGADIIYSGTDSNKIYFGLGDGNDTIYMDAKGNDTIIFKSGITENNLSYKAEGKDLIISYSQNDSIRIKNYYSTAANKISVNKIKFSNGSEFNLKDKALLSTRGTWTDSWVDYKGRTYSKKYSSNNYTGNSSNEFIYSSSTSNRVVDYILAGGGNDVIQSNSKFADINGESGNDTYIVSSLSNQTQISDLNGNDKIIFSSNNRNDINFIFNLRIGDDSDKLLYNPDEFNYLFVLDNKALDRVLRTKKFDTVGATSIYDYFNQNNIETFQDNEGYTISSSTINSIRSSVISWLQTRGYDSTLEALYYGTEGEIESLLQAYQPPQNGWIAQ